MLHMTGSPRHRLRLGLAATVAAVLMGGAAAADSQAAGRSDPVRRRSLKVVANGGIDAAERQSYLASWHSALQTYRRLGGQRRAELGYVIGVVRRARSGQAAGRAAAGRLPDPRPQPGMVGEGGAAGFRSAPALRRQPRDLPVLPRQGPAVPSAGQLRSGERILVRAPQQRPALAADDLVALWVKRVGFLTWEYYFDFNGGSPPWISGMAQGTAMQALARASQRLNDPSVCWSAKRRARGAFEHSDAGGRASAAGGERLVSAVQLRAATERPERDAAGRQRPPHLHRDLGRRDRPQPVRGG